MSPINEALDELIYYNKSNYSIRLKLTISIVLGFTSLLLSPYSLSSKIGEVGIDIPWSLLFPILASMAFGWRFGIVAALSGAALIPFFLWSNNGWANILDFFLYSTFFISIGFISGTDITKGYRPVFYRFSLIFFLLSILIILVYSYLYNLFISFNTINSAVEFERKVLLAIIIKEIVNFSILTLLSDLLLRIIWIRQLFKLPVLTEMKYNSSIFYYTLLICFVVWLIYIGLSFVLIGHSGFQDGHLMLAFLVIQSGGFLATRVIIHFTEKQLIAFNQKKENEDYLKLQVNKMPIGYIVWDNELRVKSWNPSAEKIFGFTSAEVLNKTAYETIVPMHIKENVSRVWHDLKFKGIESNFINDNLTKNGEIIICEWTNTAIKGNEGNVTEIISMVQDITIRKKVEECLQFIALHEWNDSNDNFFHSITQYLGKILNLDYVLICKVINDGKTAETLSYCVNGKIISNKKYELNGTPCQNVFGKEKCFYKKNIQKEFPKDIALIKMNAEGYIGQTLWDSSGKPIGLIAGISKREIKNSELITPILNIIATRVSSEMVRKQSKDLLELSETKYRLLFENMTSGFALHEMIYDEDGKPIDYRYIAANPAYERLTGISASAIIGKRVKEFLPNLEQYWIDTYGAVALTGKPMTYQNYSKEINKYFDIRAFSPKENQFAAVFNDITERILAEQAVKESEANLNSLINNRNDAIWSIDLDYQFITINNFFKEEYLNIFNVELNKGMSAIEVILPDLKPLWKSKYDLALTGQKVTFEFSIKSVKDPQYYEVFLNPIISDNNITGVSALSVNITERKQAEIKLLESEFFFKESQRAAFVGSYKTDFIKDNWESSEILNHILGIENSYVRSVQGWIDIVHPDDRDTLQKYLEEEVIVKQNSFNKEYRIQRKSDGKIRWVLGLGVPSFDEKGNIVTLIGTIQDITDRKLTDELIRKTEANLSAIIENTSDSIWSVNTAYEIIYINNVFRQAFKLNFGVELEIGMNLLNALPEVIRSEWKSRYDRAFNNERFVLEDRVELGFTSIYRELAVNPIVVEGKVIGASLFSRDITERMKADEALRASEERFKVVTESAEEWIWEVDKNGLYTYSNSIVEKILGYSSNEIVGKMHCYDFFEPENREQFKENLFNTFENIAVFKDFENVNIHKNGNKVILKTSGSPILNSNGVLIGYRGADINITTQKRIEIALLESEEKYRLTFITSPDSVNINRMDGTYIDINEGFTLLTGYTRDEVIGVSSKEIDIWYFPEDRKKLIKLLLKDGYVSNLESVFRCKDGTLKTALMSGRIIKINNTPHILSITRDITERKQLEDAIVMSEEKYRKLFERSNDAIFIIDKKSGKYLDANKAAERITGYNLDELKKISTFDITPIGSKKRLSKISNINKAIKLGEVEYSRPDGTNRHALLSFIPLSEEKVYGIAHDITERKQFEDVLSILSRAVDQSPISVVITDTNGLIEYVNPKFTEITGYNSEEVIRKNPNVLKSGYTSVEEYKSLWETITSGKEWRGVFHNQKKNGDLFWESALISPITDERGKITHFLAVKEDITEKKESERRILSSIIDTEEKERNRFSRELHDGLGPLLSTIKLYFQWISETDDLSKKALIIEKGEKNINEAIETIREVSNNLSPRTLSSFGAIVALKNFIENVNHTQKILIEFKTNTDNRFEKNVETVLYRVTSELINNTLKYAKATKSNVNIIYDQTNSFIKLTYNDNGIGFNMETVLSKGKGLGLVNIEQRVNSLEGKFKIDSGEGQGVSVEIELPVLKHHING